MDATPDGDVATLQLKYGADWSSKPVDTMYISNKPYKTNAADTYSNNETWSNTSGPTRMPIHTFRRTKSELDVFYGANTFVSCFRMCYD